MTRVLLGEEVSRKTCIEFQDDLKVFQDFVAWPGKNAELVRMEQRSVFQLTCNKQLQEALQDTGGRCCTALVEVVRSRVSGLRGTQLIEDIHGLQKNNSQSKACRRFRNPATLMGTVLQNGMLEAQGHRYHNVQSDLPAPKKNCTLPQEVWEPSSALEPSLLRLLVTHC